MYKPSVEDESGNPLYTLHYRGFHVVFSEPLTPAEEVEFKRYFEGPNAKQDCEVFMAAINAKKLQSYSEYRAHGGKLDFTAWEEKQEGEG